MHVIVEGTVAIAVAQEDPAGILGSEIFPVQKRIGKQPTGGRHVQIDEGVVGVAAHARMPVAEIQRVVEQFPPVCADIEDDRDHPRRVDAAGRGVDVELADRYVDPAHAPVADAEDALSVGGHDQIDVFWPQPGVAE